MCVHACVRVCVCVHVLVCMNLLDHERMVNVITAWVGSSMDGSPSHFEDQQRLSNQRQSVRLPML